MRMPRFRIRILMLAVAVVAVILWGSLRVIKMRRLAQEYEGRAKYHASLQNVWLRAAAKFEAGAKEIEAGTAEEQSPDEATDEDPPDEDTLSLQLAARRREQGAARRRELAEKYSERAAHRASLKRKYERAARYPWLPVEHDPSEPE